MKGLRLPRPGVTLIFLFLLGILTTHGQGGPPAYVRNAVDAVLTMLEGHDGDGSLENFVDSAMVKVRERESLVKKLREIRAEVRDLRDDISVEAAPDGVSLILAGPEREKQLNITLSPLGISGISMSEGPEPLVLTPENLAQTFDRLEAEGMSGVVYIKLKGNVVLERPLGMANKALHTKNTLTTIFGIGSRPIDFTVAAICLLRKEGKLNLEDPITNYFRNVPPDKQTITIQQLLTDKSGLPDFFHTPGDWDPDLAWVDRNTAEKRILSQPLLFTPGADQRHSHAAFVLLAALVEHVSGMTYYGFIRKNFLDPAGMTRTGEYGETRGLHLEDFAVGGGPQRVGIPNIPPNWGPASWLIKGSGGMYATLGDLLKFYQYLRKGDILDENNKLLFSQPSVNLDGSDRGFELFSAYKPPDNEVYLFLNEQVDRTKVRQLFRALEHLVMTQHERNIGKGQKNVVTETGGDDQGNR